MADFFKLFYMTLCSRMVPINIIILNHATVLRQHSETFQSANFFAVSENTQHYFDMLTLAEASLKWQDDRNVIGETYSSHFLLNTASCFEEFTPETNTVISARVSVLIEINRTVNHDMLCQWVIQKYEYHYFNLTVAQLVAEFHGNFTLTFSEVAGRNFYGKEDDCLTHEVVDSMQLKTTAFSFVSDKSARVRFKRHMWSPAQVVTLHLNLNKDIFVRDLPVYMLTDTFGYVRSPCFGQGYPDKYEGISELEVAENESLLIHFNTFLINQYVDYLLFTEQNTRRTWKMSLIPPQRVQVFRNGLHISFHTSESPLKTIGFDMMFAIVPRSQEPERLRGSLFNCSVFSFHIFKPMVSCNLLKECEGNEDEQDCSYRNNECGKDETIAVGTKCYSFIRKKSHFSWMEAQADCMKDGGNLPIFENLAELAQFKTLLVPMLYKADTFIGAQRRHRKLFVPLEAMYRKLWQWADGRTVFSFNTREFCERHCVSYMSYESILVNNACLLQYSWVEFVCQFDRQDGDPHNRSLADTGRSLFLKSTGMVWNVSIFQCPSYHVTRDFLYCDSHAGCDAPHSMKSCSAGGVTVPMFVCEESRSTVHYTLVCDHMQHCSDNSDEDFCKYPECTAFSVKCRNGQCINSNQQCNGKLDCYDGSDEWCKSKKELHGSSMALFEFILPGAIYLDGTGTFHFERMDDTHECPSTHVLCPKSFCLPIFLFCNGIVDCMGREDEFGCDTFKCPGFYRCRGSRTCLHAQHMCDGVPQCPQHDDELLCDFTCPGECRCQGLAFVCISNFSATSHLALRYLDASGSNMTLSDVRDNTHLVALRMSKCQIVKMPLNMTFPNLRELDLSWNELLELHLQMITSLKNLKVLFLTGNPISHIFNYESPELSTIPLEHLDLSHTSLSSFNGSVFASCPHIKMLNISWSRLYKIARYGFQFTSKLIMIDVKKCPLKQYPRNLMRGLNFLQTVHAENYKLCCKAMLPVHFDPQNCHAPHESLVSCENLLKSSLYRVSLWLFASMSLVGNACSVLTRLFFPQDGGSLGTLGVFLNSLCMSDFFMGVYLAFIGAADVFYTGGYLWHDDEWRNSSACHIAGFLCLVSSEVSVLIICLITLDRFLVLRFSSRRFNFHCWSAMAVFVLVWALGISLAVIPMLPLTSHWEFYSQTAICIPLPFTSRQIFRGYDYFFGVSILLNFILFLFIAVGQSIVYLTVRANSMPFSNNTQTQDAAIARRLFTVVMSDFLCWFPVGLLGLLAFTGTSIPGDLNAAVAILVLPINSALNPFLYTLNIVLVKRSKDQYDELLQRVQLENRFQQKWPKK